METVLSSQPNRPLSVESFRDLCSTALGLLKHIVALEPPVVNSRSSFSALDVAMPTFLSRLGHEDEVVAANGQGTINPLQTVRWSNEMEKLGDMFDGKGQTPQPDDFSYFDSSPTVSGSDERLPDGGRLSSIWSSNQLDFLSKSLPAMPNFKAHLAAHQVQTV